MSAGRQRGGGELSAAGFTGTDQQPAKPLGIRVGAQTHYLGLPPSERQWIFLGAGEMEELYGGAKSGGKSFAICLKIIAYACAIPGNRIGLFRKDLTDLKQSTLVTFRKICPPELILGWNKTDRVIQIRTSGEPTEIYYGGLGDEHDVEKAKGKEYGMIAIDEPSEIELETYLMMLAQLRWAFRDGTHPPYMVIMGSNPEPGWVEERFKDLIDQTSDAVGTAASADGTRRYIRALPRDNPYLPKNWEATLRLTVKNTAWIEKYLGGSWEVSEGQLFKEFDRTVHVIEMPHPDYLRGLKLVGSLDHASTGYVAFCVDGIDFDGNVIALGEYYMRDQLITEHIVGIRALMDEMAARCDKMGVVGKFSKQAEREGVIPSFYAFEYVLIDPSTQAKTQQSNNELISSQDQWRRAGLPTTAAWNAIESGLELFRDYVHIKPTHVHPLKRGIEGQPIFGSPSFFIVGEKNPNGIAEMIRFKRTVDDKGRIKYVGRDHWLDNQRYILMSRPELPVRTQLDMVSLDSFSRKVVSTHQAWANKFGAPADSENKWFSPGFYEGRSN